MAKTLQELFHASSLRELFEEYIPEPEMNLRQVASTESVLSKTRTPIEEIVVAALPGDCAVEECWYEQISPTVEVIKSMMGQAREGHRIAEEFPERGAYHGGPPIKDAGGVMRPYNPSLGRESYTPRSEGGSISSKLGSPAFTVRGFPVFNGDLE